LEKTKVSITRFRNPEQSVLRAVKLIGGIVDLDQPGKQVIMKPGIFDPTRPPYTDVRVAKAAAALFHSTKDISFAESDNPVRTGMQALRQVGYGEISRVGLVDLSSNLTQTKKPRAKLLKEQKFSRILLKVDVLVNLPVMKADPKTVQMSVGVKNIFGLIPEKTKSRFHGNLDEVLVELLKIFKPDLTIVDATMPCVGSYPDYRPISLGLVVAGRDVVAVDAVCAKIIGISPESVRHLSLAAKAKIGTLDLNEIQIVGLELEEAKETFSEAVNAPQASQL
jgi:uncharacterized protein (DUF362 family)